MPVRKPPLPFLLACFTCGTVAPAAPLITEFAANSLGAIADEDAALQDWIEIHNPDPTPAALNGWYLTDNVASRTKWRFPAVTLAPGDFLVIFASGKDRRVAGQPLHTNFSLKNEGEYLALVRPDGVTVEQEFAPAFAAHLDDRSFGRAFTQTVLLPEAATGVYAVPLNAGQLPADWSTSATHPAGWASGRTGMGFGMTVPGFTNLIRARNTATGGLWSQAEAITLLGLPSGHPDILNEVTQIIPRFNFLGEGAEGRFGDNLLLPVWVTDHYVNRVTGTIIIPTAGPWTFGLNSDDGGRISVDGSVVMDDPTFHGPQDHFVTLTLSAGPHTIEAWYWEAGGGDEGELFAAPGSFSSWNASMRLIGDTANGGLPVFTSPSGVTAGAGTPVHTDLQPVMQNQNASAFIRVPFDAPSAGPGGLHLLMRYNDGFVAWLNGVEVARANAPLSTAWDSAATTARTIHESLTPSGFNITAVAGSLLPAGNVLAVQGLNASAADGTFLVLPEVVSAQMSVPMIHGFFDSPTPGTVNGLPESLGTVDDPAYTPGRGIYPDATVTVVPFPVTLSTSTPGASIRYTTDGSTPSATHGTLYTGPVIISGTTVLRSIAYLEGWESSTVDTHTYLVLDDVLVQSPAGQVPGPGWPTPDSNGRVNGQRIDYGMDPEIVNHADPQLGGSAQVRAALAAIPSVSIVTDATNLFDSATGIYVNPYNRGLAWERPCSIELLNDPEGGFQVNAGLRIRGGYSRSQDNPKHAWRFFFRGEYGAAKLDYPIFGDDGAASFNQIDLRTAQNYSWSFMGDSRNTFLREEFSRQAFLDMGGPGSHVKYVHVYLNGHYWGLHDFDERKEADHCAGYLGGNKLDWDVVKAEQESNYSTGATDGNLDAWTNLFARANPLVAPGVYTRRALTEAEFYDLQGLAPDGVTTNTSPVLLDVDALIDYMLLTFWTGNTDGATSAFLGDDRANNWFGARDRTARRGFVFFPHDFEHCLFNIGEDRTGPYNRMFNDESSYGEKRLYYNPMFLHGDLMDVAAYRERWQEGVQRHLFNGGMLDLAANRDRILRLAAVVDSAILAESARWGDMYATPPLTRAHWAAERDYIVDQFLPARTAQVIAQLRADDLYPDLDGVRIQPPGGFVRSTEPLSFSGPEAGAVAWYYTTDGSDPRLPDGTPAPTARIFSPAGIATNTLVTSGESAPGATWRYRDPSVDLGSSAIVEGHPSYSAANWKHPAFDDSAAVWKTGDAELGAGDTSNGRPERTIINIGPSSSRYPALYFRRTFVVENPAQYESLLLDALIDDGAIFYINGREAGRLNMPAGAVGYAYTGLNASNESTFQGVSSATLLPSLLVAGTNQFAVEVHNVNATSGDLSFDLRLRATRTVFSSPVLLPPGEVTVRARAYDGVQWSALSDVTFLVDAEAPSSTNIVVSEIHYHPNVLPSEILLGYNDDTFFEFLELQNIGPLAVDLMGLRFNRGVTWTFNGAGALPRLLPPGGRAVVAGHPAAFELRHGTGIPLAGVFSGQLDNGGENLTLVDAAGTVIRDFAYDDAPPWPVEPDGGGASLVLIRPETLPDHAQASSWRASVSGANPGAADSLAYAAWKQAVAAGQGDFDDPDADSVPLLFEYVHGGDPGQAGPGLAPFLQVEGVPGEMLLRFDLRAAADDVPAVPEVSTNLVSWAASALSMQSRERRPGGLDRLTYRVVAPYNTFPRLYLRVRAEAP
jgi:hypothetical protein